MVAQVHARHILRRNNELEDDQTLQQKLAGIRTRTLEGKEDFDAIAAVTSEDPGSAADGGDPAGPVRARASSASPDDFLRIDPEPAIRRELREETGYEVGEARKVFDAYMSPGSVTEILHFFVAEYSQSSSVATVVVSKKRYRSAGAAIRGGVGSRPAC
jgi:hypothetical protein